MEPLAGGDARQVGGYQLQARLGAGGMGRVFLGFSEGGRPAAVKVIHPEIARDPEFVSRFRREVRAAQAVNGAYTAPVLSHGADDDPPWLATAYVPGPSLADTVTELGPLPEEAVWKLAGGLVEALRAVHACGLVHRDLKPGNVLLAADGPRLIDFGISRAVDETALTSPSVVIGTPGFMSPEQAQGLEATPASDVFCLGSVLAYAASGNVPFGTGRAATVLYRVVHEQPGLSDVPDAVRDLVARCLSKDPASRPSLDDVMAVVTAGRRTAPSAWPQQVAGLVRAREKELNAALQASSVTRRPAGSSQPTGRSPAAAPGGDGANLGAVINLKRRVGRSTAAGNAARPSTGPAGTPAGPSRPGGSRLARHRPGWITFGVTTLCAVVAGIVIAAVALRPSQASAPRSAPSTHAGSATPAAGSPTGAASASAAPAAPAGSPSAGPATYLTSLVPSGDTPQTGDWAINAKAYPNSIGYAGECYGNSVQYTIPGSAQFLDATVGVNDQAGSGDQGMQFAFVVYANPDGGPAKEIARYDASWGSPATVHANVTGATLLTLKTEEIGVSCLSADAVAVWGSARLVPASPAASTSAYLTDLIPSGDTPVTGDWAINGKAYPNSIGYPGECSGDSVQYTIPGSAQFLDATVGVNDDADSQDQGAQMAFAVYANPGGGAARQITDVTASWGNPATIHVNIRGATLLTLETKATGVSCLSSDSVAFWGNAQLTGISP